ncbi:MAG TPA: PadR family transcriptional regulator [Candidatus Binatia bacterium]|nr:PadR family transcriptional regulator [Candidatus Binatia bacterium]
MAHRPSSHPGSIIALAALALLSERPLHPYEMQRLMRDRHKDYAEGKTRALYRAIGELESLGWIEPAETTREGRRPERTVYQITRDGQEALEDWLSDLLERPTAEYTPFTVAVGHVAYLPQDRALAALQARLVQLRARLAAHEEASAALQQDLHLPRIVLLELEHERALGEAELRWVASLVDDIRSGRLCWNEEILRAEFQAIHEAEMARRARHHATATVRETTGEPHR